MRNHGDTGIHRKGTPNPNPMPCPAASFGRKVVESLALGWGELSGGPCARIVRSDMERQAGHSAILAGIVPP